jgi:tripartite-type tricarboxylate transporter receptor subunit TctC
LNDLRAGRVQAMFTSTASAAPLLAADKVRALAVTSVSRSPLLADVPTMTEAGWPAAEVTVWAGVMAPAGLARPALRKLESAFMSAILAPDSGDRLVKLGADPVGHGAKAFAEVLRTDLALWQRVAMASGVKVD